MGEGENACLSNYQGWLAKALLLIGARETVLWPMKDSGEKKKEEYRVLDVHGLVRFLYVVKG